VKFFEIFHELMKYFVKSIRPNKFMKPYNTTWDSPARTAAMNRIWDARNTAIEKLWWDERNTSGLGCGRQDTPTAICRSAGGRHVL